MSDDKKKPEELDDSSLDDSQGGISSGNITLTGTGGSGVDSSSGNITLMGTGTSEVAGTGGKGASRIDSTRIKPIRR